MLAFLSSVHRLRLPLCVLLIAALALAWVFSLLAGFCAVVVGVALLDCAKFAHRRS